MSLLALISFRAYLTGNRAMKFSSPNAPSGGVFWSLPPEPLGYIASAATELKNIKLCICSSVHLVVFVVGAFAGYGYICLKLWRCQLGGKHKAYNRRACMSACPSKCKSNTDSFFSLSITRAFCSSNKHTLTCTRTH